MNENEYMRIGGIGNYYGGLHAKEDNGKFYWGIENWNGFDGAWEEIPKSLYQELLKFDESKQGAVKGSNT